MESAKTRFCLCAILARCIGGWCGDLGVIAPSAGVATNSVHPFLLKQAGLTSMRDQQVYDASLFGNLNGQFYLRSVWFYVVGVGNLQHAD